VLVSHNMNDVFEVADSISVLYLGQTAAQVRAADSSRAQVIELITSGSNAAGTPVGVTPAAAVPSDRQNGSTQA
jgi:D-xylose transport system ATP-binding protein